MLVKLTPGVNFINMFTRSFLAQKTKKLLVFENKFYHAFSFIVLVVPFASHDLVGAKKLLKATHKNVDEIKPFQAYQKFVDTTFYS